MNTVFLQGFATSAALIIAIGAQNAFVLAQSLRREHHLPVAALCVLCDALLVAAGAGMGVDSGLPDFRGDEGFWRAYPPFAALLRRAAVRRVGDVGGVLLPGSQDPGDQFLPNPRGEAS